MPTRILLTGFDPFAGARINPSLEIARDLDGSVIDGAQVVSRPLPCVFAQALPALRQAIADHRPMLVLALGQAGGRTDLSLERVAVNLDDAPIVDNAGAQPIDEPVVAGGPAAYFTSLPVKAIVGRLRAAGIPASLSHTAGSFVCNHVFYGLMHALAGTGVRGGFMHVPWLPEQVVDRPGVASMDLATMVRGTRLALQVGLAEAADVRVAGGSLDGSVR